MREGEISDTLSSCKVDISLHLDTISIQYWFLRTPWVLVYRYTSGIELVYLLHMFVFSLHTLTVSRYTSCIPVVYLCILLHIKVREDEISELEILLAECWLPVEGGVENSHGKVNILLQTYISQGTVESFSLISDLAYVAQVSSIYQVSSSFFTCKTGKVLSMEGEVWRCAIFSKTFVCMQDQQQTQSARVC